VLADSIFDDLQPHAPMFGVNGVSERINIDRMSACSEFYQELQNLRLQKTAHDNPHLKAIQLGLAVSGSQS